MESPTHTITIEQSKSGSKPQVIPSGMLVLWSRLDLWTCYGGVPPTYPCLHPFSPDIFLLPSFLYLHWVQSVCEINAGNPVHPFFSCPCHLPLSFYQIRQVMAYLRVGGCLNTSTPSLVQQKIVRIRLGNGVVTDAVICLSNAAEMSRPMRR